MTVVSTAELERDLKAILERLGRGGEEVVVVRDDHAIARMLPGTPAMTAREFLGDLHAIVTDEEGEEWLRDMKGLDRTLAEDIRARWE